LEASLGFGSGLAGGSPGHLVYQVGRVRSKALEMDPIASGIFRRIAGGIGCPLHGGHPAALRRHPE
jgi:hypothetical protein